METMPEKSVPELWPSQLAGIHILRFVLVVVYFHELTVGTVQEGFSCMQLA